jgi:hypothetical protein
MMCAAAPGAILEGSETERRETAMMMRRGRPLADEWIHPRDLIAVGATAEEAASGSQA